MPKKKSPTRPNSNRLYFLLAILVIVILFSLISLNNNQTIDIGSTDYRRSPPPSASASPTTSPTPTQVYLAPIPFPVSTKGWKAYTNEQDNFTIKYPPDYNHQFSQVNSNLNIEEWSSGTPRKAGGYTGDHIVLSIYPDDGKTELPDLSKASQNISLGGQNTLLSTGLGGMIIYVGPILHNGYIYKFQYDLPNQSANANNFYQMVSTFQFLK